MSYFSTDEHPTLHKKALIYESLEINIRNNLVYNDSVPHVMPSTWMENLKAIVTST